MKKRPHVIICTVSALACTAILLAHTAFLSAVSADSLSLPVINVDAFTKRAA